MTRLFVLLALLRLLPSNAADQGCVRGVGSLCQESDEEALQLLQSAAVKAHGGLSRGGSLSRSQPERTIQVLANVDGDLNAPHSDSIARGVEAVKALEVAQSAADRDHWPDIEKVIRSVSSVVSKSADQLCSAVDSVFSAIEGLATDLHKKCSAAKASLLKSMNATGKTVDERVATFQLEANSTLGTFVHMLDSLDKKINASTKVMTKTLTRLGQGDLASHTDKTLAGVSGWAETCVVAASNVSDALAGISSHTKDTAVSKVHQLNVTLDALLGRVTLLVKSLEDAALNVTQGLLSTLSSKLNGPAVAAVNKTLNRAVDAAKSSGAEVEQAAKEVTSGIREASASTGLDVRSGGGRPQAGIALLATALLVYVRVLG
mmetsp:Transcript_16151/g.48706  ORF Transcript_16151/g.48706 Transcript_16151/m.48706 type:complete len:376 (+) Transcript_16151:52-1179(+)|eukprot:CAMPEP_0175278514 /NCGR_PEP_ID=MMETSP0093-20121207/49563_1 /TAXON_ID=311494 /ORGANISM="Alexandrium monilatum, Strain CCMP3105" /LENGTH=375 /DNA_ID=CAMNT_0016573503 /DNA_START=44 /DNA_END=1171 /DNA_ORIENTATION=+